MVTGFCGFGNEQTGPSCRTMQCLYLNWQRQLTVPRSALYSIIWLAGFYGKCSDSGAAVPLEIRPGSNRILQLNVCRDFVSKGHEHDWVPNAVSAIFTHAHSRILMGERRRQKQQSVMEQDVFSEGLYYCGGFFLLSFLPLLTFAYSEH
jgi:hypothetical protein